MEFATKLFSDVLPPVRNALGGFAYGSLFATCFKKEEEIKQGANYVLSSPVLWVESLCVNNTAAAVHALVPSLLTGVLAWGGLCTLPFFVLIGLVRQGHYGWAMGRLEQLVERFSPTLAAVPRWLARFPHNHPLVQKIALLITEHLGKVYLVAMIVGSVALVVLGDPFTGCGTLVALAYSAVHSMGWVPMRVSAFVERYSPIIEQLGMLLSPGTFLLKAVNTINFVSDVMSRLSHPWIIDLVDEVAVRSLRFLGPRLLVPGLGWIASKISSAQPVLELLIEAIRGHCMTLRSRRELRVPVLVRTEIPYDEIQEILDGDDNEYILELRHSAHYVTQEDLDAADPSDPTFDLVTGLWGQIEDSWTHLDVDERRKKAGIMRKKYLDDRRFRIFLRNAGYPVDSAHPAEETWDNYCRDHGVEDEYAFFCDRTRASLQRVEAVLKGTAPVTGNEADRAVARAFLAAALPYYATLNTGVELEDALFKLAVEGGDYCARGIRRVAQEMYDQAQRTKRVQEGEPENPTLDYARKFNMQLQQVRSDLVDQYLNAAIHEGFDLSDVHFRDMAIAWVPNFFIPKHSLEADIADAGRGLAEVIAERIAPDRIFLCSKVLLDPYRDELRGGPILRGKMEQIHFWNYIRALLGEHNTSLTPEQMDELKIKFENDLYNGNRMEVLQKYLRLALVSVGALVRAPNL